MNRGELGTRDDDRASGGRLIVEQIVSADGYAAEADGGIGFCSTASPESPGR